MLKSYLKFAFRDLARNKIYSFINIFGLSAGLACFILIALYIFDELTFDRFHKNVNTIFRVVEEKTTAEGIKSKVASVAYNVSRHARADLPEVTRVVSASVLGRSNILNDENTKAFYEDFWLVSSDFFNLFDFGLVGGDRRTALLEPHSVVITEETAKKIFGTAHVVGKTLRSDRDTLPFKITAVLKNFPANSHLGFNIAFSESTLESNPQFKQFIASDWSSNTFVTYLQLKQNSLAQQTGEKIMHMVAANRTADNSLKSSFFLQPLKDIHFNSAGIEGEIGHAANISYIYIFSMVAVFVLLIACINYMNLTTARLANRSKEIAVRKVAGASKPALIRQFLSEAFLITFIALLFALVGVKLLLPSFNLFAEKQLSLGIATDSRIWVGILLIVLVVGFLSGTYPAFFQSRLKPFLLLKNKVNQGKGDFTIRRMLVVFQFSLSIIMILATMILYLQVNYMRTKNMGFNKNQLVVIDINSGKVRRSAETIKSEYAKLNGVKNVSVTSRVPGEWKVLPKVKVKTGASLSAVGDDMFFIGVDEKFLETYEIPLLKGRNFSVVSGVDSSSVLLNETAAKLLGINEPSQQLIQIPSIDFGGSSSPLNQPFDARVVGIVRDFNFRSLREAIAPMVMAYKNNPVHNIDYFTSRVSATNIGETLKQMENILHKIDPGHLFEYNFLDKQWELFYREDQKRQTIFLSVALMTILIACLGLFGLATYSAKLRIKEIGIRKVLGASVSSIVAMLSKDFLQLVIIAALIAFPIAGWAMSNWLEGFAYRINISWWMFVLAGVAAVGIALVTVGFQAIKAAVANPVNSLRAE